MYCFSHLCQLISELLKWIVAISLLSQSWKTPKLHYHLNYLQTKGKMPSFPWQNSKRCNGDRISRQAYVPYAFLQSQQDHSGAGGEACVLCISMRMQFQDKDPTSFVLVFCFFFTLQ